MAIEHFRVITFLVYLGSWAVLAIGAILGAIPRRRQIASAVHMRARAVVGLVLQCASALPISLFLDDGPLRPRVAEMAGGLVFAPVAALLYLWAQRSAPRGEEETSLTTGGAYALMRHPMYAAFLAMLVATGLLASAGWKLAVALALYGVGTELRIAEEEEELASRFPKGHPRYVRATRWRYLWGLR
ncbi:MAG: isoprenylcysteine carboxylmethyltransferase family protein [Acidobacteriota bacterium]